MNIKERPRVAIVNYGVGNVFSVKQACQINGLEGIITYSPNEIRLADAVILPGVGAFGTAMKTLKSLHLIDLIKEAIFSSKPFLAICLGMQLLMERSYEFGEHRGLGIIKGSVVRFSKPKDEHGELLKIPQVGWNTIYKPPANKKIDTWNGTLCEGVSDNAFMYFVHSYYPELKDGNLCLSLSRYGNIEFCSSFAYDNIFACQFHPERSGFEGLKIYRNLAKAIKKTLKETVNA